MEESIKKFLDAVDTVLNSNTLLLIFPAKNQATSPQEYLKTLFLSGDFEKEFLKQDLERDWNNYHTIINNDLQSIPINVDKKLIANYNPSFQAISVADCEEILTAMLTEKNPPTRPTARHFFSPYRKQITLKNAQPIVQNFLEAIKKFDAHWKIYEVEPTFLYTANYESEDVDNGRAYFDGMSSDSAFIFLNKYNFNILLVKGVD